MNYRDLCISVVNRIYFTHNPDKTNDVQELFEKYKGREKELVELICKKYNVSNEELKQYAEEYKSVFNNKPQTKNIAKVLLISFAILVSALLTYLWYNHSNENSSNNTETAKIENTSNISIEATEEQQKVISRFWSHVDTHLDFETINPSITDWLYNISKELSNGDNTDAKGRMNNIKNDEVFQDLIFLRLYEKYSNDKEEMRKVLNAMCQGYEMANPVSDYIFKKYANDSRLSLKSNSIDNSPNQKSDKEMILNALRNPVENELKQEVKFVVNSLKTCQNYAIFMGKPVKKNCNEIDYSNTEYQKIINDGAFDDGIQAILFYDGSKWLVKEYVIGATDSPLLEWVEKYQLYDCKKEFGFVIE
jgi:hypothetical protein